MSTRTCSGAPGTVTGAFGRLRPELVGSGMGQMAETARLAVPGRWRGKRLRARLMRVKRSQPWHRGGYEAGRFEGRRGRAGSRSSRKTDRRDPRAHVDDVALEVAVGAPLLDNLDDGRQGPRLQRTEMVRARSRTVSIAGDRARCPHPTSRPDHASDAVPRKMTPTGCTRRRMHGGAVRGRAPPGCPQVPRPRQSAHRSDRVVATSSSSEMLGGRSPSTRRAKQRSARAAADECFTSRKPVSRASANISSSRNMLTPVEATNVGCFASNPDTASGSSHWSPRSKSTGTRRRNDGMPKPMSTRRWRFHCWGPG
jgi:hypothetical protein